MQQFAFPMICFKSQFLGITKQQQTKNVMKICFYICKWASKSGGQPFGWPLKEVQCIKTILNKLNMAQYMFLILLT